MRFFKVSLEHSGKKVNPAVPLQVTVDYEEGLYSFPAAKASMVEFTEEDTIVKDEAETVVEDGAAVHFSGTQDTLNVMGTFWGGESEAEESYL